MKKALIFGVTGQDGSYLAEFLLSKGYHVHGVRRRSSTFNLSRINSFIKSDNKNFSLHYGDVTDSTNIIRLIKEIEPDEIYDLAAQSHVHVSFDTPEYTANTDALGTLRILEAIRILNMEKTTKFYQASTSELYGKVKAIPQNENTPFNPQSPYAIAKLYAYYITVNYRNAYDMFACNGILFNHESPRRGDDFVTRKITRGVASLYHGSKEPLLLGNLNSKRDWGYAKEYVEAMWLMLQQEKSDDYVLATGKTYSVRDFVNTAFQAIDITIEWSGSGINEVGRNLLTGDVLVKVDPRFFRPAEVDLLVGDSTKAQKILGWEPTMTLNDLIELMVKSDIEILGELDAKKDSKLSKQVKAKAIGV